MTSLFLHPDPLSQGVFPEPRVAPIERHKSNPKVATRQEIANHQTTKPKPSGNKSLSLFQIATHKYQRTKQEKISFSHTWKLNLLQQHSSYIRDSSRLRVKIFQAIEFAIHTNSLGIISTCVDTTLLLQVEFKSQDKWGLQSKLNSAPKQCRTYIPTSIQIF